MFTYHDEADEKDCGMQIAKMTEATRHNDKLRKPSNRIFNFFFLFYPHIIGNFYADFAR